MNDPKVQADLKREGPEWDKAREVFQGPCSPQHQNDLATSILASLREANLDLRSYLDALKNAVRQITIGFKGSDSSWNVLIGFDGRFGGTLVVNMDFFLQRTVTELWTLQLQVNDAISKVNVLFKDLLLKLAVDAGAEVTHDPYEIRLVNKGSLKIIRMDDSQYLYNLEVLKVVARVLDRVGFASEDKKKAVEDIEAMVTARTGFPWRLPRMNPPPVDFIKPDPEDLEREWQQALERQRSLFGAPPRESIPEPGEVVREPSAQLINGDPPGIIYQTPDQKKTLIFLEEKVLMKKSANFLRQLYEVVVKCGESDQQFKDACVKYLFNASVQKKRIELTYESRFDTNRVLTHPKRIFYRRHKKKTQYITFDEIPKLDTLPKC